MKFDETNTKEKILIVAPYVPKFDIQSGCLRLFTIIKILTERFHVVFYAATTFGKIDKRHLDELEKLNVQIYTKETNFKEIFTQHHFLFAFLEFYHIAEYYLPRIRILQRDCFIITDSVDVHFYREKLKYDLTQDPAHLQESERTKIKEMRTYSKSDVVVTVTQEDGNILKKENDYMNIEVIPNIHTIFKRSISGQNKNKLLFVGSFKHEPNVDAVEYFCKDVMPSLIQALPEIKLRIIGANPPNGIKQFSSEYVEFLGFVPSVTPYLCDSYISIAPLRFGAGMKGKIGESMAHGVPVVTTSVGNQGMNLVHRNNVMIANEPDEYVQCIKDLVADNELYKTISNNEVEYIKNQYSESVVQKQIYQIIDTIKNGPIKEFCWYEKSIFYLKYILERLKGLASVKY